MDIVTVFVDVSVVSQLGGGRRLKTNATFLMTVPRAMCCIRAAVSDCTVNFIAHVWSEVFATSFGVQTFPAQVPSKEWIL